MKWIPGSVLMGALCVLSGCSSMMTNGEVTHFVVDEANQLRGPWHGVGNVSDAVARYDADSPSRDSNFLLSFDTSFVKYLPDLGAVNEVIIVYTFRDGPAAEDGSGEIKKIVGPMRRQPDGALLPDISRVTYGPTALRSEYLNVRVQIVEYDRGESDDSAAFMDFVEKASSTLADPVTAAEIRVAKEVASTIFGSNENDVVLDATFDLIPYDEHVEAHHATGRAMPLPLRVGTFGLVKTEIPSPAYTFFPLTSDLALCDGLFSASWGDYLALPLTIALDIVHLPFASTARAFLDTPDRVSMTPLVYENGVLKDDKVLVHDPATRHIRRVSTNVEYVEVRKVPTGVKVSEGDEGGESDRTPEYIKKITETSDVYRDKTWMTFSVSRGHRALPPEALDRLTTAEQKIVETLGRRSLSDRLDADNLQEAIDELTEAKKAIKDQERMESAKRSASR